MSHLVDVLVKIWSDHKPVALKLASPVLALQPGEPFVRTACVLIACRDLILPEARRETKVVNMSQVIIVAQHTLLTSGHLLIKVANRQMRQWS